MPCYKNRHGVKFDGICNLLKYAFHLDRQYPDRTALPKVTPIGSSFTLTYVRNKSATDLTYVVEVSTNLQSWYSGANYTTDPIMMRDDTFSQKLQVTGLPQSNVSTRFVRLRVTGP